MNSVITPRPYQVLAKDAAIKHAIQDGSTLLVMATGTGKTVTSGLVMEEAKREHGRRALFLAHREELVNQAAATLPLFGLNVAIEMGEVKARSEQSALFGRADVVVATVQSLQKKRLQSWARDEFGLIFTDEAHHGRATSYKNVYEHFRDCWHIGLTATPERGDGRNLGAIFRSVAFEYSLRTAQAEGWLAPTNFVRLPVSVDLRDIMTTGGDFNLGDLDERIGPKIEELCDAYVKEAGDRFGVIFTPCVGSATGVADCLRKMGYAARYVAGTGGEYGMAKEERRRTLNEFQAREFQHVVCCDLLVEGWDAPHISAVGIMRPTKMAGKFTQMVGRGTRLCDGKDDCLVLDFDWQTDDSSRHICRPIDLFDDGDLDDEVVALAGELMEKGETSSKKAIDEAEETIRRRKELKITLTGRKAQYRRIEYNPMGIASLLNVPMKKSSDFNPRHPATPKQLEYLRSLGMKVPDGLSLWGASKWIDTLKGRREAGLASVAQVGFLTNLGVTAESARAMTFDEARRALDELAPKKQQGSFSYARKS